MWVSSNKLCKTGMEKALSKGEGEGTVVLAMNTCLIANLTADRRGPGWHNNAMMPRAQTLVL